MILFLDTSALVKLYIAEPGSEAMRRKVSDKLVAVSQLAYAEAHATFARLRREDLLSDDERQLLIENFEQDWQTALQIPVSEQVLPLVPDLCHDHPLRGADALQLAAALMVHRQGVDVHFVTSDQRLLKAAEAEGLTVFDPTP
ncbi:MAG: type II toxin-antitoxin system VapC family toxin [bacterium]|nr:type II toxin-antitoxin system VapC family toxin [bacterium]